MDRGRRLGTLRGRGYESPRISAAFLEEEKRTLGEWWFAQSPETEVRYEIRHAERLRLGTPYPLVAQRLSQVVARVGERDEEARPWVLVDATGVGRPIVDLIEGDESPATRKAGLGPSLWG